jgi:hypothetical protein
VRTGRRPGLERKLKKAQEEIKELKRRTGLLLLANNALSRHVFAMEAKQKRDVELRKAIQELAKNVAIPSVEGTE